MGRRCRQILLFIAAFSFLRGLQVGFVSEDSLRTGFIGDLLSGNKSDDSAHATTTAVPFSEVRKTRVKSASLRWWKLDGSCWRPHAAAWNQAPRSHQDILFRNVQNGKKNHWNKCENVTKSGQNLFDLSPLVRAATRGCSPKAWVAPLLPRLQSAHHCRRCTHQHHAYRETRKSRDVSTPQGVNNFFE